MNFTTYHEAAAGQINQELKRVLGAWLERTSNTAGGKITKLLELYKASVSGGKVLRGTLVQLGYELAGAEPGPEIIKAAAAYEILHASLLIHDDIIDKSPLRRERATLYKALGEDHYAISQAICLGDMGFFLATKLLAETAFDAERKSAALDRLSDIIMDTVAGQLLDTELAQPDADRQEGGVLLMQRLKTASYSVAGPLAVGATLAGADEPMLAAINRYGHSAGLAYQIQDDILGVFGDEAVTGKSAASDIEENKNTLLISYALEHADRAGRELLAAHYGQGRLTPRQHQQIKQVLTDSGALNYARRRALEYAREGRGIIPRITSDPAGQALLEQFTDVVTSRQK